MVHADWSLLFSNGDAGLDPVRRFHSLFPVSFCFTHASENDLSSAMALMPLSVDDNRRQQVFLPIFLLQLVNLFWSFLIWRILYRMITGTGLVDTREEGEDQEGEPVVAVKGGDKAKKLLGNGSATGQAVLNGDAKKRRK